MLSNLGFADNAFSHWNHVASRFLYRVPPPFSRFIVQHSSKSTWLQKEDFAMSDQRRSRLIIENPIGNGLNGFRATSTLICEGADLRLADEAVDRLKREG
jgi:hypothetical protein